MKRAFALALFPFAAVAHAQLSGASATPALRPIAPPVPVPLPLWEVIALGVGAAAVVALLVFLIAVFIRRRATAAPPPLSPRELALRDLRELQKSQETFAPLAFSVAVSDILRTYIARQFGLHAREQTSQEFLATISGTPHFTTEEQQMLTDFLTQCDLIKFARQDASSQDTSWLWTQAEAFVRGSAHESV